MLIYVLLQISDTSGTGLTPEGLNVCNKWADETVVPAPRRDRNLGAGVWNHGKFVAIANRHTRQAGASKNPEGLHVCRKWVVERKWFDPARGRICEGMFE